MKGTPGSLCLLGHEDSFLFWPQRWTEASRGLERSPKPIPRCRPNPSCFRCRKSQVSLIGPRHRRSGCWRAGRGVLRNKVGHSIPSPWRTWQRRHEFHVSVEAADTKVWEPDEIEDQLKKPLGIGHDKSLGEMFEPAKEAAMATDGSSNTVLFSERSSRG